MGWCATVRFSRMILFHGDNCKSSFKGFSCKRVVRVSNLRQGRTNTRFSPVFAWEFQDKYSFQHVLILLHSSDKVTHSRTCADVIMQYKLCLWHFALVVICYVSWHVTTWVAQRRDALFFGGGVARNDELKSSGVCVLMNTASHMSPLTARNLPWKLSSFTFRPLLPTEINTYTHYGNTNLADYLSVMTSCLYSQDTQVFSAFRGDNRLPFHSPLRKYCRSDSVVIQQVN